MIRLADATSQDVLMGVRRGEIKGSGLNFVSRYVVCGMERKSVTGLGLGGMCSVHVPKGRAT